MDTSYPQIIWANKPGCSKAVAEFWIGEDNLWFTVFVDDDDDDTLKIELLVQLTEQESFVVDFMEMERLIGTAKRELLAMVGQGGKELKGRS